MSTPCPLSGLRATVSGVTIPDLQEIALAGDPLPRNDILISHCEFIHANINIILRTCTRVVCRLFQMYLNRYGL